MKLTVLESSCFEPYWNLALEEHLLFRCEEDERILYLWQNEKTVVIGRNQNAARECAVELLERDGVHLARRNSGGGAVYHDLGNLNFSFFAHEKHDDTQQQTRVVLEALRSLGIDAAFSGRNDILVNDRKISGSAFFRSGAFCCHHGTVMVDVDQSAVERYLRPSAAKLEGKGVPSVRSRVVNLRERNPAVTIDALKQALCTAFESVFAGKVEPFVLTQEDLHDVEQRREKFADPRWIYGTTQPSSHTLSHRFSWGEITLRFRVENGKITDVQIETDAMEPDLPEQLKKKLVGVRLEKTALGAALSGNDIEKELAAWLETAPLEGETWNSTISS